MIVDIQNDLALLDSMSLLDTLLADHTTGKSILWATDAYSERGRQYEKDSRITRESLIPEGILRTRAQKESAQQDARTRQHAEVFTPLWVVRKMNDYADQEWFAYPDVFFKDGKPVQGKIRFWDNRKTWKDYVDSRRLEITCGEAPFLVTRYNVETGEILPVRERAGILDRKLRVVGENTDTEEAWITWTARAVEATYGYEFQGDNLLIARLNVLMTVRDFMEDRFGQTLTEKQFGRLIQTVVWNLWQMDGLTDRIPFAAEEEPDMGGLLFGMMQEQENTDCRIYDWRTGLDVPFYKLKEDLYKVGEKSMKFDFIIGNPPYQMDDGGNGSSASPVYNRFIEEVEKMDPEGLSFIIPAKWYSGGKGLNDFRRMMLTDKKICRLVDYTDSKDCFENVDVAGGVCYFVRNRDYNGDCLYTNYYNGQETTIERDLSEFDTFVRYPTAVNIIRKVLSKGETSLSTVVSTRKPFGLSTDTQPTNSGDIFIRYNKGIGKYQRKLITVGKENIDKYQVMISYLTAEHAGQPDKSGRFNVLSTIDVLPPQYVCSETYLTIGSFDNRLEADNMVLYLKTKFVRFLVAQVAISQHITKSAFNFVPLQDYTKTWSDKELYCKYQFDQNEILFIESMIKEMM